MHPQALLLSLLAAGAVATPIVERDVVTEYNVVTAVVTVTATPGSYSGGYPHRAHRYHHHKKPEKKVPSIYQAPDYPRPKPTTTTHNAYKAKQTTGPPPGGYAAKVVSHHNVHRQNHTVPDVQWDQGLADTAMKIAQTCVYAHNTDMDGGGYGQNIAAGIPADNITAAITDAFYNGEVGWYAGLYGSEPPKDNFEHWGHFSQIVWKGTTHVGCATFHCSGSGLSGTTGPISPDFTVCNYKSAGNYDGEYTQNVLQPRGDPTVNWSY